MNLSPEEFHPLVELAAERASDGLLCLDTEGAILYANDAAARLLGRTPEALERLKVFEISPEMNPALWRELWKEIRSQGSFAFEFALAASGDRQIQVDITAHLLKAPRRDLAVVYLRDIQERKRLQTLQQEFVSTASHELRTPMTVIREGVSQVAEGLRGDINESQKRALTLALNGIDRLGRIMDDLLDISKIESGKTVLRRERVDLAALAREVGATFHSLAQDRGLDLRVSTPAGPLTTYADHDRLVQVLTNLVGNSFKFTESGRIQITVADRGTEAECAVEDTGMGMETKDVETIFNKFEQLAHESVTGEKGSGLGLSICRGLIELHKGRIWAESGGPGQGARVSFVIPRIGAPELFAEQLKPMLRNVARRGGNLSTVIFRVRGSGTAPVSEHDLAPILEELERWVRTQSGRRNDLLVRDSDAVYLALESTVAREAERLVNHVRAEFERNAGPGGSPARYHLTIRIAGFPESSANEEEYLRTLPLREAA